MSNEAVVNKVSTVIIIKDEEIIQRIGDPIGEMNSRFEENIKSFIDKKCQLALSDARCQLVFGDTINWKVIRKAIAKIKPAKSDYIRDINYVLIVSPYQYLSLRKDQHFNRVGTFGEINGVYIMIDDKAEKTISYLTLSYYAKEFKPALNEAGEFYYEDDKLVWEERWIERSALAVSTNIGIIKSERDMLSKETSYHQESTFVVHSRTDHIVRIITK
jgi:hypothetical protein